MNNAMWEAGSQESQALCLLWQVKLTGLMANSTAALLEGRKLERDS